MKFKTTQIFDKRINQLLTENEYTQMRQTLTHNPSIGDVVRGTGGVRKMKWVIDNNGKSGGIIFYWHNTKSKDDEIYFLFTFLKNEQENLTAKQKSELKKFIEGEYNDQKNNE